MIEEQTLCLLWKIIHSSLVCPRWPDLAIQSYDRKAQKWNSHDMELSEHVYVYEQHSDMMEQEHESEMSSVMLLKNCQWCTETRLQNMLEKIHL